MFERTLERFLFASRWLLAPFYVALVVWIAGLLPKSFPGAFSLRGASVFGDRSDVVLGVLSLVALTLNGSLVVIVIIAGYENFVSKIDIKDHKDWPEWMSSTN